MNDVRFAKLLLLVNCGVPGALLAWDALHHQLGANPVKFAILTTGMLSLIFLILTLVITPLRRITGWNRLIFFRRTLGLYAFFYALSHFFIFFVFDRSMSFAGTGAELLNRPYLLVGATGLLCMVPLAVTSTNGMIRRLGARRWQLLHRLVYVTAVAGAIHFYMQAKADKRQPVAFAVAVGIMLGYRLVHYLLDTRLKKPNSQKRNAIANASVKGKSKFWSGQFQVARITQETPNVKTFCLQLPGGGDLSFRHLPGQNLNLSLHIEGKRVNRSYTIASPPTRTAHCEITIKREKLGAASRHLHDTIREGDLLNISAPAGKFTFTGEEDESIVLIAGGVGITPMMSILRALTDRDWPGEVFLIYCVREELEIIFAQELEMLQQRFKNLYVCITLSKPKSANWAGSQGRISAELLRNKIPGLSRRLCYICGPTAMMDSVKFLLHGLGVPESRIRTEAFAYGSSGKEETSPLSPLGKSSSSGAVFQNLKISPAEPKKQQPAITFSVSGKTVIPSPGQTILEAGEAAGLELEYECRSGICGTCKSRLLAGSVMMDVDDALSPAEKSGNFILLCQARSIQPVTVEA